MQGTIQALHGSRYTTASALQYVETIGFMGQAHQRSCGGEPPEARASKTRKAHPRMVLSWPCKGHCVYITNAEVATTLGQGLCMPVLALTHNSTVLRRSALRCKRSPEYELCQGSFGLAWVPPEQSTHNADNRASPGGQGAPSHFNSLQNPSHQVAAP